MTKTTNTLLLAVLAVGTMGVSLPGCNNDQIASLQQNIDMANRRIKQLEDRVANIDRNDEMLAQAMKTLGERDVKLADGLKTVSDNQQALKAQLDRKSAPAARSSKPAPKKRK